MTKPVELIVYTLETCPHCEMLKKAIKRGGYKYSERDLSTAEALTELRVNGVFVNEAPVLQRGEEFYTTAELFPTGMLDDKKLGSILSGE
ncbi:MAG: glutaredoxin domain-containing protein [Methanoregula sp.]|jgi:glutaredoxin|uniref:glutaredoxin family protein n=1 Tax=Methanoregula sp. TaxID=2052170 RepID=UPI003C742D08